MLFWVLTHDLHQSCISLFWKWQWYNHSSSSRVTGQRCWPRSKCVLSDKKSRSEALFCTTSIYRRTLPFKEFRLWVISRPGSKYHFSGGGLWYLWNNTAWYCYCHSDSKGKEYRWLLAAYFVFSTCSFCFCFSF